MSNEAKSDSTVVLVIAEEPQAAFAGGTLIPFARREWEVLRELVEVPGHVKTTEELSRGNPGAAKYVCRRIRRKLGGYGFEDVLIHHRGWGYRYIGRVEFVRTIQDAFSG